MTKQTRIWNLKAKLVIVEERLAMLKEPEPTSDPCRTAQAKRAYVDRWAELAVRRDNLKAILEKHGL